MVRGVGLGGVEVALQRRLARAPRDVATTVVTTLPEQDDLKASIEPLCDDFIQVDKRSQGIRALINVLRDLKPDVLLSHTPRETLVILGSHLPRSVPVVPVVHHPHASEVRALRPVAASSLASVNHRAHQHIAVSHAAARGEQTIRARKVEVCPLGASVSESVDEWEPWPLGTRIRLLSIGRLRRFKNFRTLISAVHDSSHLMRREDAHLAIIGSGPDSNAIRQSIINNDLGDVVSLWDARPDAASLLRKADGLVIASRAEGGPITAMEAVIAGTRVAMTPVGLADDLIHVGDNVLVSSGVGLRDITSLLRSVASQNPLTDAQRSYNQREAIAFSVDAAVTQFYQVVRQL